MARKKKQQSETCGTDPAAERSLLANCNDDLHYDWNLLLTTSTTTFLSMNLALCACLKLHVALRPLGP